MRHLTNIELYIDNVLSLNLFAFLFSFIDLSGLAMQEIEFILRCTVMFVTIIYTIIKIANKTTKKDNDV